MKLTKEQIDHLFAFTEKKFVRFYDLQIELVDHLAEKIEEEMEANKGLSFESALQKVYAGFGIFGFAKIVQEKSNEVQKASDRIWLQEVKRFFTIPQVAFTVLLATNIYLLSGLINKDILGIGTLICWLIYDLFIFKRIVRIKKTTKNLMLLQFSPHVSFGFFPMYGYFVFSDVLAQNRWVFTIVVVLIVILNIACLQVYKKVRDKAVQLYPETFVTA